MRVAILSDIHGNFTAFEAVHADIRRTSPDLILHGGDLADNGSSPCEIVDRIRDLGWHGVMGNTDEMLVVPEALEEFASQSSAPAALWELIRRIASATRSAVGEERLAWLRNLPRVHLEKDFALVHASPQSCWRAPASDATDAELEAVYGALDRPTVIFGHTHIPSIRRIAGHPQLLINTGSVGLPYDGDPRASYLLLDDGRPSLRRIEYDLAKELQALSLSDLPGAAWTSRMLRTSSPQMP
jgi:putative phosphoesterase